MLMNETFSFHVFGSPGFILGFISVVILATQLNSKQSLENFIFTDIRTSKKVLFDTINPFLTYHSFQNQVLFSQMCFLMLSNKT